MNGPDLEERLEPWRIQVANLDHENRELLLRNRELLEALGTLTSALLSSQHDTRDQCLRVLRRELDHAIHRDLETQAGLAAAISLIKTLEKPEP